MEITEETFDFFKPPSKLRLWKRSIKFFYQRLTRGWDDSETWNLEYTLSKFILPRLIRYGEIVAETQCHPCKFETLEEWLAVLDDMIYFHHCTVNDIDYEEIDEERYKRGKQFFADHYENLWW